MPAPLLIIATQLLLAACSNFGSGNSSRPDGGTSRSPEVSINANGGTADDGRSRDDATNDSQKRDQSKDKPKLAEASEPQIITGYNLSFDGARPRCTSEPVTGVSGQYKVSCLAVEIVDGVERIPAKPAEGVTLAWQAPTAPGGANLSVVNCATTPLNMAQNCVIQVAVDTAAVDVTFRLSLTESTMGRATRQRTETDILTLPYGIMALGWIPEIPRLISAQIPAPASLPPASPPASGIGALRLQDEAMLVNKTWVFASQRMPLHDFPIASDAQALWCGDRLFVTSRSRLFAIKDGEAKHVAGSLNERNLDDLSHPLRTFWVRIASLGCRMGNVLIETRGPTRIYELSPDGVIKIVAKDHLEDGVQVASSLAVDAQGNLYYIDGMKIRRRSLTGSTTVAFDGSEVGMIPWQIALDEDAQGGLRGLVLLDIGSGYSATVYRIDAISGKTTLLAGKAAMTEEEAMGARLGAAATSIQLRAWTLSVGRNSAGERVVLIGEGGDAASPPADPELLMIDSKGKTHILLGAAADLTLRSRDGGPEIKGRASIGNGTGGLVMTPRGEVLVKVSFAGAHGTTTNFVTVPLAGGPASWAAGRLPPESPSSVSKIDATKAVLGQTLTTFGTDGTMFVIDNTAHQLWRLEGDSFVRLPVSFEGQVTSATIGRDPATPGDRLVYVEQMGGLGSRIQGLRLSGNVLDQPQTMVASPGCDMPHPDTSYFATVRCQPTAVALDAAGRVVFYDFGYHLIRRLNTDGTYTDLAGTQDLTVASADRSAGSQHAAANFGFSMISALRYDASGALLFVEQGGTEQYQYDAGPSIFTPVVGKLDQGTVTVLIGANGNQTAHDGPTDTGITSSQFQLAVPEWVTPLPDGSLIFSDTDRVLMLRQGSINRFFGGPTANADCGAGTLDRATPVPGQVPILTNALNRFCAGKIAHLSSTGSCLDGKTHIAIAQHGQKIPPGADLASMDLMGSGMILRIEMACDAGSLRQIMAP